MSELIKTLNLLLVKVNDVTHDYARCEVFATNTHDLPCYIGESSPGLRYDCDNCAFNSNDQTHLVVKALSRFHE